MHLKRFLIKVERTQPEAWRVNIYCQLQEAPLNAERCMRRLSDPQQPFLAFPLPSAEEVQAMDAMDDKDKPLHYKLCATTNPKDIDRVYRHICNRNLDEHEKDAHTFGGYLFATLLGDTAWKIIEDTAGTSDIELALCWPTSEWELSQLPWEMMCNIPNTFLASDPSRVIGITRLVPRANQPAGMALTRVTVSEPLKVLFVVGAAENDARIRPGAESLGLLQRLQDKGKDLLLNAHTLLRASSQAIEDEIAQFQPSVVHFICHGEIDPPKGYLYLVSDDQVGKTKLDATELYGLLTKARQQPPPIVVLNACYSGATATQESVSLAAKLVELGIPMVVAMGGEIADHACRLFTWRFYAALLQEESVACATAEGRWAGITHVGNSERSVDWAYPALFLAEHISPEIITSRDNAWISRQKIASEYQKMRNPGVFCDRLDILEEKYKQLLNPGSNGAYVKRVLAIETRVQITPTKVPQYGKSRLLEELAARAVRDGHVPCLVKFKKGDRWPTTLLELGMAILAAIDETRKYFELNATPNHALLNLIEAQLSLRVSIAPNLPPNLQYRLRYNTASTAVKKLSDEQKLLFDSKMVREALQLDLKVLAQDACTHYPDVPHLMVLVLIDEVHHFDAAANDLIEWLDSNGLGSAKEPVPVIFTFSNNQQEEYNGAVRALMGFLNSKRDYVIHLELGPFYPSDETDQFPYLPYQQFLLHYEPPLVSSRNAQQEKITRFFKRLHEKVRGIPSRLELGEENDDVMTLIETWQELGFLEKADNEHILNESLKKLGRRGAV
jgi:hypothetical protein